MRRDMGRRRRGWAIWRGRFGEFFLDNGKGG
jgi:hypothetical protein